MYKKITPNRRFDRNNRRRMVNEAFFNKYKKTVYKAVQYRSTIEIMTSLHELQMEASENFEMLNSLLGL